MANGSKFSWPEGIKCAVSLTYDDSLKVHYEMVAPLLSSRGLTATFYTNGSHGLTEHVEHWRKVASMGHELGNHTLFHPCRRIPGHESWLPACYDLQDYTTGRWSDEIRVANCLLGLIDGRGARTYGNTCCNTTVGRGEMEVSLDPLIEKNFVAGRGPFSRRIVDPATANLAALGHYMFDKRKFDDIRVEIEQASATGGWYITAGHGVGEGTHGGFMDVAEHAAMIDYLGLHSGEIWTASMVEIAQYVRSQRGK